MSEMKRRRDATQATVNSLRDKKLKLGRCDCGLMVVRHLVRMGSPVREWAGRNQYTTGVGAIKQLKKLGFDSLQEAMDSRFERIAPAAARIGDVIEFESEAPPGALAIAMGNGRVLCFVDGLPCICQPEGEFTAAWRIPIKGGAA